jgi:2-dehydropantoate 2-reductase
MRTLIVGAGALGGYFGAKLIQTGRDVTFLVRPLRARQLAADGLQILSPNGNLSVAQPPVVLAKDLRSAFDLILLSCKAHDLASAMDSFAPAVGPETAILPLLNGMAHMPALDARFGVHCVLGGASNISAVRDPDGTIRHLSALDRLYFGVRDLPAGAPPTPRIRAIADTLLNANFEAHLRPTIMQDMWEKWAAIATGAGLTCLMRASVGDIVAAGGAPLARQLLAECASVAASEGFPPAPAFLDQVSRFLTTLGSTFTTSMLRDLESGAPIEAHQIIGDLLDHARRHSLATPLLAVVHAHLRCHEERRSHKS